MKGTWQGSGTWQTSGPGLGAIAAVALLIVAVIVALEWLLARIWWLVGGTVVLIAATAAALYALIRWTDRREARFAERRRAELAMQAAARQTVTARVIPQVAQAAAPALENHVHYHVHVGERDAAAVAAMLPGPSGAVTTEKE